MNYKADITISPAFQWAGSKWRIGSKLIEFIPEHKRYVELFAGTASVLLRKKKSELEFINDINDELINFYLILQNDFEAFISKARYLIRSDAMHRYYLDLETADRVLRALRFYYLTKYGITSGGLRTSALIIPIKDPRDIGDRLDNIHKLTERLKSVSILNRDYMKVIDFLDYPDSFFFVDPPYYDNSNMYDSNFGLNDHIQLRDRLKHIKGKFLLTINVCQEVYDLYNGWAKIRTFDTVYSAFKKHDKIIVNNYLISNYELDETADWVARLL